MWQFLANELIFEILQHFLPGLQLSVIDPSLFPWYLGEICSRWRNVFISSPQFWCKLDIDMDDCFWKDMEEEIILTDVNNMLELAKMAVKRSGDYPLTLSINMYDVFDDKSTTSPLETCSINILAMLISHSMRWKNVNISLHKSCYSMLSRAKGHLPILRSLQIMPLDISDCVPGIFMDAPRLTRISFVLVTYSQINWSLVTELHLIELIALEQAIVILRQISALEKLVVRVNRKTSLNRASPIHLPTLKELYVLTPMLLDVLHTPGLEILHFSNFRNKGEPSFTDADIESFAAISSGYFPTVRNLRKLAISVPDIRCAPIFEAAPSSIQELKLYHPFISTQLPLVARCPNLHNIKMISVVTTGGEISRILTMLDTWIVSFKHLIQFSLEIGPTKNRHFKHLKRLKKWFDKRDIKFISKIYTDSDPEMRSIDMCYIPSFESEW